MNLPDFLANRRLRHRIVTGFAPTKEGRESFDDFINRNRANDVMLDIFCRKLTGDLPTKAK